MGRWSTNTRGRLEQAALQLYIERGFEQTTVAEIAAQAGLTERTFFRHFADKREVLFGGAHLLQELVMRALADAPADASPMDAVVAGLKAAGGVFQENAERSRKRQTVIEAHPELQARELSKLAALGAALAEGLRARGLPEPAAGVAAEAGLVVFKTAFDRWIHGTDQRTWDQLVQQSLTDLRAVVAGA